jgi:NAD(P)-dependent dehydrogenase (short-subunit alcohol dehydrogenase family)
MAYVLVTGANRGLGLEFVKQYAAAGYRVFAASRSPSAPLTALARADARISLHSLDVADAASIAALATELAGQPIDLLLCNAGSFGGTAQKFGQIDYDAMLDTLRTNTLGPLRMAEAFVEHVARSERRLIAAVTSGMGSIADTSGGYYAYRASKAALNMSYRNLALDLRGRGIITCVINPGWVQTDMGGAGAPTKVEDSIAGMRRVFDAMSLATSGSFMDYRGGTLAW